MSFAPTPRALGRIKAALFALALVPLARLVVAAFTGGLGVNPIEFVTRSTGTWTLSLLLITLAVTPLRRVTGWNWLIRLRRMLGLFAFFYACLHFTTYVWLDQFFDPAAIVADSTKIRTMLGWLPQFDDLDTIVAHAIAWERQSIAGREGVARSAIPA